MAIVWMDGFEDYSASNGFLAGAYITLPTNITYGIAGRYGGKLLHMDNALQFLQKALAQTDTVTVGIAAKTVSATNNPFFQYRDANGLVLCTAFISPTGAISVVRGSSYTTNILVISDSGAFTFGVWNFVEIEFTRHASAGVIAIHVNGAQVASATGVNSGASPVGAVFLGDPSNSPTEFDDYYITDTASRIGEIRIDSIAVNADTAQKDFTPLTGTDNYAMVSDLPGDNDTTYVVGDTIGQADLYETAGLIDSPSSILAVQVRAYAKKTDTGLRTLKTKMDSGGTIADGVAAALSTAYAIVTTTYETDPHTAAAWTAAAVNAATIGVEIAA